MRLDRFYILTSQILLFSVLLVACSNFSIHNRLDESEPTEGYSYPEKPNPSKPVEEQKEEYRLKQNTPAPAPKPSYDLGVSQNYCRFSTDCEFGEFCRDRGDKVQLCMGKGQHGHFCNSSSDCTSHGFCRKTGDGFKRCMVKGKKNQPCAVGTDCDGGLFCRDRGDGLKVCM